ncbi:hypothetical protein EKO04_011595 [Ascochyta lentis]|uniref:Uncharacterized protein n=1 Tax=Ascochyta lentis TaxID=205686 RepID=A0A8H7MEP8_9PLEO|nr:hypothetical protein EKO04_011595 [Ascochyta lentis]
MTTDTPVDALTRELAQYLESAETRGTSKTSQRKHFKDTLQRLQPLRAQALSAEIENLYNVGAWYLLFGYPPKFPSWADANDARLFAASRHMSALTNLKKEWKQPDAAPKIREAVRDVIPLPTWPGRDFLDKLVKIAGVGGTEYPLDTFLTELPHFLHAKHGKTKQPKSQYFKRESRRCILNLELDEFYNTVVQPWILGPTKPRTSSRKRRKTSVGGCSIDTSEQAEDEPLELELARRSSSHERDREQTVARSSPSIEVTGFIQQPSRSQSEDNDDGTNEIEDTELSITDIQSLNDDDEGEHVFTEEDDQTEIQPEDQQQIPLDDAAMARRAKGAKGTGDEQAQKEVEQAFDLLLDGDANDDVQWLQDNTKLRVSLRRQIEVTKIAVKVAIDALAQMSREVASRLPPSINVTQATANAEARLARFTANEMRILEQQRMLQTLADEMDDEDMCILNTRTVVNREALVARRAAIEQEIAHLKEWTVQINDKWKSQEEKKKELDDLEDSLAESNEALDVRARLFFLATQPATRGAFEAHVAAMDVQAEDGECGS